MTTWELFCELQLGDLVVLGRKCHSTDCRGLVSARVYWLGRPLEVCAACEAMFHRIAVALGLTVHVEPVEYAPVGIDASEQRFRAMELT